MSGVYRIIDLALAGSQSHVGLLIDSAAKGLVLILLALALTIILRKSAAAWRHLVCSLAMVGLIAVPLLSACLPEWQIPVPKAWVTAVQGRSTTETERPEETPALAHPANAIAENTVRVFAPQRVPAEVISGDRVTAANTEQAAEPTTTPGPASAVPASVAPASVAAIPTETANPGFASGFARWLFLSWAVGAAISMLIPLAGLWQVAQLRRTANHVDDPDQMRLLQRHQGELGIRRSVQLLESSRTRMPLTWGVLRPVLLVPDEAADWSESRQSMVLLHELAHIKRLDWLTQMMGQLASVLHWFNPLVWFVARRMQVEREQACDDMVLAKGATASDYASELMHFATRLRSGSLLALAAVPMARQSSLEQRVRSILDGTRRRGVVTKLALIAGLIIGAGILLPVAMLRPVATPTERHPAHIGTAGLSTLSMHNGDTVDYAILYVGDFNTSTSFTHNTKLGTWHDEGTIEIGDEKIPFERDHRNPNQILVGGRPFGLSNGRVFVIDTITPQPERPWQIRQVDAQIPIITTDNIEEVFEIAHQPGFLPTYTAGFTGEYPMGSGVSRSIELYSRHDEYRTRFALLHSTKNSTRDINGSNDPKDDSWIVDDVLHLAEGDYRFRCISDDADSLKVNDQEFNLTKGRVFTLAEDGGIVQHAEFPPVIRDTRQMLKLNERIHRMAAAGHNNVTVEVPKADPVIADNVGTWPLPGGANLEIFKSEHDQFGTVHSAIIRWPATDTLPALRHEFDIASDSHTDWAVAWKQDKPVLWLIAKGEFQSGSSIRSVDFASPGGIVTSTEYGDDHFDLRLPEPSAVVSAWRSEFSIGGHGPQIPRDLDQQLVEKFGGGKPMEYGIGSLLPRGPYRAGGQRVETAITEQEWSIAGIVRDADGTTVAGIPVTARTELYPTLDIASGMTDETGRYNFSFRMYLETLAHFRGLTVVPRRNGDSERNVAQSGRFHLLVTDDEDTRIISKLVEGNLSNTRGRHMDGLERLSSNEQIERFSDHVAVLGQTVTADFVLKTASDEAGTPRTPDEPAVNETTEHQVTVFSRDTDSAISFHSSDSVHFVLYAVGQLKHAGEVPEEDGEHWRTSDRITLTVTGKPVRTFTVAFSTATPDQVRIDGRVYKLRQRFPADAAVVALIKPEIEASKDGATLPPKLELTRPYEIIRVSRLFALSADNPPLQIDRTLPLRAESDLTTIAQVANREMSNAMRYRYSRQLAQLEGWVISLHVQHMMQHSDGARQDWLRVFPDGRAVIADQRRGLLTIQLAEDELRDLVNALSEHPAAALAKIVNVVGSQPSLPVDFRIGAAWDQATSHVFVRRDGELRSLFYQSPAIGHDKPQTGMSDEQWKPIQERLFKLVNRVSNEGTVVAFEDLASDPEDY